MITPVIPLGVSSILKFNTLSSAPIPLLLLLIHPYVICGMKTNPPTLIFSKIESSIRAISSYLLSAMLTFRFTITQLYVLLTFETSSALTCTHGLSILWSLQAVWFRIFHSSPEIPLNLQCICSHQC